jgi:hypothetical protein
VHSPGVEEAAVFFVGFEDVILQLGLQENQKGSGNVGPARQVRQVKRGEFLREFLVVAAMGVQARESALLHDAFLGGEVVDGVLDHLLQQLIDDGVGAAGAERMFQFGNRAKELLMLLVELSDIDAAARIPANRFIHARSSRCAQIDVAHIG